MINEVIYSPKVSIIMPMYKCESFVEEALDLVREQTFDEIEIICVLDGPDDGIKSKVESRAKIDPRVICLVQEHAGAGAARNTGLDIARGDYLLFLDADDLFKPNLVERLHTEAVKYDADVVMCSYSQTDYYTKQTTKGLGFDYSKFLENTVIDCTATKDLYKSFIGSAWNKMFRKDFIAKQGLRFMDTRMSNDEFFVTASLTAAKRLVVIKEDLLTIRRYVNPVSITSNRAKHSEDVVIVMRQIYNWLKQKGYWKTREEDYYYKVIGFLHYNAEFEYNEKFVEEMARVLSTEKPWKNISNVKMAQALELRIPMLETIRNDKADELNALRGSIDISSYEIQLKRIDNKINAIRKIRSLMKQKYGRDLNKRDNPIAWLSWSVGYRGWKGTLRRIKEKIEGYKELRLTDVVCSGHITVARHYLTFFIPAEVYREKVSVEDLSIVVRCNGYYPFAVSGEDCSVITPLGPNKTHIINGGAATRQKEIMRIRSEISPGLGVYVQVRFKEDLLKNKKGDMADNNYPVSVHIVEGKILLK